MVLHVESRLPAYVVPDGMARSVFENKYSRRKVDGTLQSYEERVREMIYGNFLLDPRWQEEATEANQPKLWADYKRSVELAVAGIMPTSGRHLQPGDADQKNRLIELHSNCSTTVFSFMLFRLLLRGSGVGRDYSSVCCRVNWDNIPDIRLVLDESHADYHKAGESGWLESRRDARHKYDSESENVRWFTVEDSREGWSKCIEILETAAFQEKHKDKLFIFDFSDVRPEGSPIAGLQGRPASGPIAFMKAMSQIYSIKNIGMRNWKQAMYIDHYLAAAVIWGGARRAARMAVKNWRDRDVLEFIDIKRGGFLWSANNSLLVDQEFWDAARKPQHSHARRVFEASVNAAYWDGTGEPGYINIDLCNSNKTGMEFITGANFITPEVYGNLHPRTQDMATNIMEHIRKLDYPFLTNPCGEIVLSTYGGLCIIGDVNLSRITTMNDALDAVEMQAKFLVRVNLMHSEYSAEVKRTNRIGVSLTGIHEFAYKLFGLTFYDIIDYYTVLDNPEKAGAHKAHGFWKSINLLRIAAEFAAAQISEELGMVTPHTVTTIKPSGTVSKVMNCTEGAHLPALAHYLRWVQFKSDDPDIKDLVARGYPLKDISHRYSGHIAIGFPTKQPIVDLMADKVVTADDTTPEQNFIWLRLLEHHWLGTEHGRNNQISYTLKYDSTKVSYEQFMELILQWQPQVRCCSVMPSSDWKESEKIYGYVPEQPITASEYVTMMAQIIPIEREQYDDEQLTCEGGVCPIEPDINRSN